MVTRIKNRKMKSQSTDQLYCGIDNVKALQKLLVESYKADLSPDKCLWARYFRKSCSKEDAEQDTFQGAN